MRTIKFRTFLGVIVTMLLVLPSLAQSAVAVAPGNDAFQRTWARTDKPVADGQVSRTWMWGPEAFTGLLEEDYTESPEGSRTVQYFDKSRMEITNPGGDSSSIWYVTNGLLVVELMTGQMQTGNGDFEAHSPSQANVAGDADDATGPTYATFNGLQEQEALAEEAVITQRVSRDGTVTDDPALAGSGVQAVRYVAETEHSVAGPFWEFMNSTGLVSENGSFVTADLFQNPFYATGFPIAEAYWAEVKVAGTYKDVLMQCFERRCLTYTPDNPDGWQVEAGNVGLHYHTWRYEQIPDENVEPPPVTPEEPEPEPTYTMAYIQSVNDGTTFTRTIYTMNSDGTGQQPIGLDPDLHAFHASLSPDGQTMAFTAWEDTGEEEYLGTAVYTVGIDGNDLQQITPLENARQPADIEWSPDGSQIAFTSWESSETVPQNSYLYVISPDGSSETRLTDDGEWVGNVAWSPDGSKLAFSSDRGCPAGTCGVWVMNADGTNPELINSTDGSLTREIDWSPGGDEIVYASTQFDDMDEIVAHRLMIMNADGTDSRQLVDSPTVRTPHWDVSGDRVYFADYRFDENNDIFVVDRDGSNEERLTQDQGGEFLPAPPEH